ncbi:VOC family protein [Sediminicola luteus]|uniref:VOC domain-containing protein n=1 Tax=Sediminicola luteus TaxID=319238 RepID=A0A2A4G536_9FLAO|nr:hypothetical protein [Sediminicola luteus]PCE63098.1 hypothetical protein B7P33_17655 [Sediminicola luteus]
MRTFNHVGIPTTIQQEQEIHMEASGLYVTDFNESPNKIEWLRFEADSPLPELLKTTAHIAYEVPDLEAALEGNEILMEPFDPAPGLTVAFIIEEGAPIELMQFQNQ